MCSGCLLDSCLFLSETCVFHLKSAMKTISFIQGVKLCFMVVILLKSEIREHLFDSSFFGMYIPFDEVY